MKKFFLVLTILVLGAVNSHGELRTWPYMAYPPGSFGIAADHTENIDGSVYVQTIPGATYLYTTPDYEAAAHNGQVLVDKCRERSLERYYENVDTTKISYEEYDQMITSRCQESIDRVLATPLPTCTVYDLQNNVVAVLTEETYISLPRYVRVECTPPSNPTALGFPVFIVTTDFDYNAFLSSYYPGWGVFYPTDTQWSYELPSGDTWLDNVLIAIVGSRKTAAFYWLTGGEYTTQDLIGLTHITQQASAGLLPVRSGQVLFNGNHYIGEEEATDQ